MIFTLEYWVKNIEIKTSQEKIYVVKETFNYTLTKEIIDLAAGSSKW